MTTTTTTATINPAWASYIEKARKAEQAKQAKQEKTEKALTRKTATRNASIKKHFTPEKLRTDAQTTPAHFDIVTAINETVTRIYDRPAPVPFTGDIWQWLAINSIHTAIATSAVKWQAYRDYDKNPCKDPADRKTQAVAMAILAGENLTHSLDDCIQDCYDGLLEYANNYGIGACYHLPAIGDETVYTPVLHRDFIRAGFRAVSNGMRAMASRSAVLQTAIETKNDDGQWVEISTTSVPALAKYTAWECDIMIADIVRNIVENLPTENHAKWLYCRLDGYKKVDIERELGVTRQKCREIEKTVITIGQKVVDYYDLFA